MKKNWNPFFKLKNEIEFSKKYLVNYKKSILAGSVLMLISTLMLMPTPLITMHLIDNVVPNKDFFLMNILGATMLSILILSSVINYYQGITFLKVNANIVADIQKDILRHIQKLPLSLIKKRETGFYLSYIQNDTQYLHGFFANTLIAAIKDILVLFFGIIIIFYIHWKLALITLIILPGFIAAIKYFSKKIRKLTMISLEKKAAFSKKAKNSISMMEVIQCFTAEKKDLQNFNHSLSQSIDSHIKQSGMSILSNVCLALIGGIGPVIILWYGISEVISENLKLGELISFNALIAYVFGPVNRLSNFNLQVQQSISAIQRILALFSQISINSQSTNSNLKPKITGNIKFQNINFSYGNETCISNFNLEIQQRSVTGIIGKSGSGKTTISRLLLRLYDCQNGIIHIDNTPIEDIDLFHLRNHIAIVNQNPQLFPDTIKNNLLVGNPNASFEDITNATKMVGIHDFIMKQPDQYNTEINEESFNISGGEKQRLAIVRAILRNPRILILDEFTSSLDTGTESEILENIKDFIKDRTTLIIAHRLSSIKFADRIIEMESGKIINNKIFAPKELKIKPFNN